jgi:hypothetical protein
MAAHRLEKANVLVEEIGRTGFIGSMFGSVLGLSYFVLSDLKPPEPVG